jgi:hypothetical protein
LEFLAQDRFEKVVWAAEALLDKMDELPPLSYSEGTPEFDGKTLTASKKCIERIHLFGYARLVRMANKAARGAVVGVRDVAHKQLQTHED